MYKNNAEKILIEAGLSEEQALIYISLLDKGPMKANPISSWTGIKRGLAYKVLSQLENLGLISKKEGKGTVAIFSPNHPSKLIEMIEEKEKTINITKETIRFSLGILSSKFNLLFEKPNIQFFEGKEGIINVIRNSYNSQTEILSYSDSEAMNKYYPDLNQENKKIMEKSKIKKRIISIDNSYIREIAKNDNREITERRVLDDVPNFATIMQIYDNQVTYITLEQERAIGIIIEDKAIYNMQKELFETIWKIAKPII